MKAKPQRLAAVDAYIASAAPFAQPILQHLREAIHDAAPGVVETIKWSRPFFVYNGIILANMSAFQQHCTLGLWGSGMSDRLRDEGYLAKGAMGSFGRLTAISDLPPRNQLLTLISEGAVLIDSGQRTQSLPPQTRRARAAIAVPAELAAALRNQPTAADRFDTISPSARREYCEWVGEAKRAETRTARASTAAGWIAEGKSRNWKYEAKTKA